MRKNVGNFNRNFAFESKLFSFLLMQDGNSNQEDDKGSGHLPRPQRPAGQDQPD